MEKYKPRLFKVAAHAGLGILGLSACATGQTNPPTPEEFNEGVDIITLQGVTATDGGPVYCAMYGSGSINTSDSKSWFGFDCDFEGTATFPTETTEG